MNEQNQDALKCADILINSGNFYAESSLWFDDDLSDAAANGCDHIRRLVAENEAKEALLRQAVEALKRYRREVTGLVGGRIEPCDAEDEIRLHLEEKQ